MKNITVRLDKKTDDEITIWCKKIGATKHSLINILIFNFLKNNKKLNL